MDCGAPPPAYSETSVPLQPRNEARPAQIRRKPVSSTSNAPWSSESDIDTSVKYGRRHEEDSNVAGHFGSTNDGPVLASQSPHGIPPIEIAEIVDSGNSANLQISSTSANPERAVSAPHPPLYPLAPAVPSGIASENPPSLSTGASYLTEALQDARHFAGGPTTRPSESTRHFSILRHSHGLVFYQGTSTTNRLHSFRRILTSRPTSMASKQRISRKYRYAHQSIRRKQQ